MTRNIAAFLLLGIVLIEKVISLNLVSNYKYWRSTSRELTYDYSGNSRHGSLKREYIVTDRGLSPNTFYFPTLMSHAFLSSNEYTISSWILNYDQTSSSNVHFYYTYGAGNEAFIVFYKFDSSGTTDLRFYDQVSSSDNTINVSNIQGWNFHTVRMYQVINTTPGNIRIKIEIYLNLMPLCSSYIDLNITQMNIVMIHMGNTDSNGSMGLILYETWVHLRFSNISELSGLISTSCGCVHGCPTSPSTICLPNYGKYKNKQGILCSSQCTDNSLSCNTSNSCISESITTCCYGLYDLASSECLFYCPGNSCICSTEVDPNTSLNVFGCTCKLGYKSISRNPPACISNRCLTHHTIGYKYVCDSTETGYVLDANGECCICASDYNQVLLSPLVCMNILHCLDYTQVIGSSYIYICLTCDQGYSVDSNGSCNQCSTNYIKVSDNPFTCTREIDYCIDYIKESGSWICEVCKKGYSVDLNGECNLCESGYYVYDISPFTCAYYIENCKEYAFYNEMWTCNVCREGYSVDLNGECNLCESGYYVYDISPFTCAYYIENCKEYAFYNEMWTCNVCREGYQVDKDGECNQCDISYIIVSQEPLLCALEIENCLDYNTDLRCEACKEGYRLSNERNCDECEDEYYKVSEVPLACIRTIEHCDQYHYLADNWKCKICKEGYKLSSGLCNECDYGFINVGYEDLLCKIEIDHCIEYDLISEESRCIVCEIGYSLDSKSHCTLCDSGYISIISDPRTCLREILNCKEYKSTDEGIGCKECIDGYILYNSDSLCINEINFCSAYIQDEEGYSCQKCQESFRLDCDGACESANNCICEDGLYLDYNKECKLCSDGCVRCAHAEGRIECFECKTGYNLLSSSCKPILYSESTDGENTLISNEATILEVMVITSISVSIISFNINSILSIIGTIQILSYILLYNLTIPSRSLTILKGMTIINIVPNIFEYFIPNEDTLNIERFNRMDISNKLFLLNSGKILTSLTIMMISILFLKILSQFTIKLDDESFLKKSLKRMLVSLQWNLVIGFLIQGSLELTISSLINLYYASFSDSYSIVGFIFSIIVLVRDIQIIILISPFKLFSFYLSNYEQIQSSSFDAKFRVLYDNLKPDNIEFLFMNIFELLRRIVYGVNMILFYSSPYIQVVINSSFAIAISFYVFIFHPYKTKLDNAMNLYTEFNTFLCLTIIGAFLPEGLSPNLSDTAEWAFVILIYMSIMVPAFVNIIVLIKDIILKQRSIAIKDPINTELDTRKL